MACKHIHFLKIFSAKSAKVFSKQILMTVFLLLGIARKNVFVLKSRVAASVILQLCELSLQGCNHLMLSLSHAKAPTSSTTSSPTSWPTPQSV